MPLEAGLSKPEPRHGSVTRQAVQRELQHSRFGRWAKRVGLGVLAVWSIVATGAYWMWSSSTPVYRSSKSGAWLANHGRVPAIGVRERAVGAAPDALFPFEAYFVVIGDYGSGTSDQIQVADTLKKFATDVTPSPAFVISTGDQIYEHGINTSDDRVLSTVFEKIYADPSLDIPWYITVGNHDCEGSIDAMLQYAKRKSSLWFMPQRYYKMDHAVGTRTILRVIVLDACDLVCGQEPRNHRCTPPMNKQSSSETKDEQYRWLEEVLSAKMPAGVDRMWTIVVSHWSIFSFAGNGDTPQLVNDLNPLLKKYKVHAYFSGHDHCLQHIKKHEDGRDWNYFVSGAGGYRLHKLRPNARADPSLVHAAMSHGFMTVHVTHSLFRVQMVAIGGEVLYTADVPYQQ